MEDKYIDVHGTKMHYTVSGHGPAIILMHGWGCQAKTLASVQRVAEQTHTVYNVDFPGFGLSPEPEEVWDVYDYTQAIEQLVSQLGLERPTLLGHSFGGRVAIIYASRHDVDRLILVDAAGIKNPLPWRKRAKQRTFKVLKGCGYALLPKGLADKWANTLRGWFGSADYSSASPKMRAIMSKVVNEDLRHLLPRINADTLLIWGEKDTATPLADAKLMEKAIPHAGLVSFPEAGHYSFLDNPGQFAAVLSSYLTAKI